MGARPPHGKPRGRYDPAVSSPSSVLADVVAPLAGRRAWISGARGFIGGRLADVLVRAGVHVARFEGDLRRSADVAASLRRAAPDVVFHLGARVDVRRDPALDVAMREVLFEGTLRVAEAVPPGARLVHAGTCEEYGTIPAPYAETDTPSDPVSPYARWKLATTRELLRRGGDVVVARPFLTYGPGQRPRQLVPSAIRAALAGERFPMTSGVQTREWNYVDDTVAGLVRCATADVAGLVNVCGGPELSVVEMVRRIFAAAGASEALVDVGALPQREGEVARFFGDATRCRELLGHVPAVSLDEGLRRTIAWWRARGEVA